MAELTGSALTSRDILSWDELMAVDCLERTGRLTYSGRVTVERMRTRGTIAALTMLAFVLAHESTFLLTFGSGAEQGLARSGHGQSWALTVVVVLACALVLTATAMVRLVQLGRDAGVGSSCGPSGPRDLGVLGQTWLRLLMIILPGALMLFIGEENLEHAAAGLPLPGLDVLGAGEYQWAPIVFLVASALVAFVGALYRWQRQYIEARLAASRPPQATRRAARGRPRPAAVIRSLASLAGRNMALRAPPDVPLRGCARRV